MKRFLLSLSLILVCLNPLCAQTPARKLSPEEEEAKRAIEERLAELVEAMRRKDTPARLQSFTPDWRAKTIDGDVMTLKDLEEHFGRQNRNIMSVEPET